MLLGSQRTLLKGAPAMAQIILDHVEKAYPGGVKAVDGLSLDIQDGEFMVLVGPSGCGKSTALRSIAGLEEITAGTISIGDRVVNDLPPKDRDIAMVFQNYALYPHMTVEQNLAFGLQLRKTPKAEIARRTGEAAKMLGLEPYLKRKPAALSGGQRQRVAMGRAIVREPRAFLMDEPLSNLDAKLRVSMRASLNQLHERLGVTTVYVTHDQVEAMTLGDRVCVLRDGQLQQVDTPQALFEAPVNLFVAGFIGSPAMNFVTAELAREDGPAVTFAGYTLRVPPEILENKPGLAGYFGKKVILGIRPSDFEDASLGQIGRGTMRVTAGVTEELGSILAEAPKSAPELVYAHSPRGFALISQRTETLQRMYFQCDPDEDVDAWSQDRIWAELQARVAGPDGFTLAEGPITEKTVLRFRSFVAEPMRYGRLLLAGDAAHTVPPTGAKGLNLALADVRVLAEVLERAVRYGDAGALEEYGPRALTRVWKAQHFSYWMTSMLHALPSANDFDLRRQIGELESVASSVAGSTYLAEAYTGWPRR
jgi:multiple sugar transport system ATP-binding protein